MKKTHLMAIMMLALLTVGLITMRASATTTSTTTTASIYTTTTSTMYTTTTAPPAPDTAYYCDVDKMSSSLPMTVGGDLNSMTEATSSQYDAIASSDDSRWTTPDPGSSDEVFIRLEGPLTPPVDNIESIDLHFEGYLNYFPANFSIWARDVANGEWDQIGTTEYITTGSDGTITRSITSDIGNYKTTNNKLIWGVYESTPSQSLNIDHVDVVVNRATTTTTTATTTTTTAFTIYHYYCDVDNMSPSLPMTVGGDLNSKIEATESEYDALALADDIRWTTPNPGFDDEVFLWMEYPATGYIVYVNLIFEGYLSNSSADFSIWARNVLNNEWEQIGDAQSFPAGSDTRITRGISGSVIDNYISNDTLIWGVYESTSSQSLNADHMNTIIIRPTTSSTSDTTSSTTTTTTTSSDTTSTTSSTTTTVPTTTSTTTTSGGGCDCGTCNWWGSNIPMCCESCSGWGWYDGGCRRSCVCQSSCEGGSVP